MDYAYGESVEIVYPPISVDPFSGEAEGATPWPDLAGQTVPVLTPVPVYQPAYQSAATEDPTSTRPLHSSELLEAILPYGTRIAETCTVTVLTGPYAGTFSVNGEPGHWKHPMTGWEAGTLVKLIRIRG